MAKKATLKSFISLYKTPKVKPLKVPKSKFKMPKFKSIKAKIKI